MKLVQQATILLAGLLMTSCMKANYQVNGNEGLKKQDQLTGYAFAQSTPDSENWDAVHRAVHQDLQSKNYFYDNENPDVLVMVKELPKGVKLLSGNTYSKQGINRLESGKIKTKGKTLLIQMVETQNYQTIWRGFAAAGQRNQLTMLIQPRMVESVLNQ
jgi:hypothetical protein